MLCTIVFCKIFYYLFILSVKLQFTRDSATPCKYLQCSVILEVFGKDVPYISLFSWFWVKQPKNLACCMVESIRLNWTKHAQNRKVLAILELCLYFFSSLLANNSKKVIETNKTNKPFSLQGYVILKTSWLQVGKD